MSKSLAPGHIQALPSACLAIARQVAEAIPWPVLLLDPQHRLVHANIPFLSFDHLDAAMVIDHLFPAHHHGSVAPAHPAGSAGVSPGAGTMQANDWQVRPIRDSSGRTCLILVLGLPVDASPGCAGVPRDSARISEIRGRRREIIDLLRAGLSVKEIATTLRVREPTVRTHIYRLRKALGCQDILGLRFGHRARQRKTGAPDHGRTA